MEATEVRLKKGEPIDRALRRLKKKLDKEGTLKELRNRRHFEKPSEKKRSAAEAEPKAECEPQRWILLKFPPLRLVSFLFHCML